MKLPKKRRCVVAVQQPRRNQKRRGANVDGGGGDVFPRRINAVKHHHNNNSTGVVGAGLGGGMPAQKLVINGSLHSGSTVPDVDLENGSRTGNAVVVGQKREGLENGAREGGDIQLPVSTASINGSSSGAGGRKTSRASLLGGILNRQSSVHSDSTQQVRESTSQQNSNSCYQQNTPNVHLFGGLHA